MYDVYRHIFKDGMHIGAADNALHVDQRRRVETC